MEKIAIYILLFFIYSNLGWCMEVLVTLVTKHKLVNRGFLIGPICPIYGYGCLFIILLLNKYLEEPLTLFIMALLICSILEYITSYLMEKIYKARWWDYTNKKFNINGRVCLENLIPFGILGTIIMYIVNPFFLKLITKIPNIILYIIVIIFLILYIIDNVISSIIMSKIRKEIKTAEKDQTEEITKRVKEILLSKGYFSKRIIKAFPNIQTYKEMLVKLRENINKKIKG